MTVIQKRVMLVAALATPVIAQESGVSFNHKAWSVACDNTLTCRVGGQTTEENLGGVLLTRAAGADTATSGEIMLPEDDENQQPVTTLTLWINGQRVGDATQKAHRWWLSDAQSLALIQAIKGRGTVEFRGDNETLQLSGDGAYAALLKVDDVQGRINTPGAWVKKGDRPEKSVAKAVAVPVIQAGQISHSQPSVLTKEEAAALRPQLLAALTQDQECDYLTAVGEKDVNDHIIRGDITATPLDATHTLLSTQCWGAAYNQGYGFWVTDPQRKAKPVAVTTDAQTWEKGVITNVSLASSAGSCVFKEEWVWDGRAFRQSLVEINDGCWFPRSLGDRVIPTLISDVKHEGIK